MCEPRDLLSTCLEDCLNLTATSFSRVHEKVLQTMSDRDTTTPLWVFLLCDLLTFVVLPLLIMLITDVLERLYTRHVPLYQEKDERAPVWYRCWRHYCTAKPWTRTWIQSGLIVFAVWTSFKLSPGFRSWDILRFTFFEIARVNLQLSKIAFDLYVQSADCALTILDTLH